MKKESTEELTKFFKAIFKGVDPKNYIDIRTFKVVLVGEKWEYQKVDYFFERIKDINRLIKMLGGKHFKDLNVHYGVAARSKQSGTEADVKFLTCFWCDLDARRKNRPELPTKEELLEIIKNFKLAPSIIVDSGNGYHCYWLLSKIIEIKNSAYKLKMRGVLAGLSKALGGDMAGIDLSRCLRLPGTLQIKSGDPGLPVKIVKFDPGITYDMKVFTEFYIKQEETILGTVDLSKEQIKNWIKDPSKLVLPENFYALLDQDEKLKETFSGTRPDLNDTTKSGYSMSLASLLVHRRIFTDEQIIKAMILQPRARKRKKTPQNLLSTLKKAKGSASKKKEKELKTIIAGGFRPTDLWNSENFFKKYEGQLLFCKIWNSWLVYQEGKWQEDDRNKTQELGKKVIMDYYRQASEMLDDKERKRLVDQARKSESQRAIRAMTELATSALPAVPDDFDQDIYTVNLKNVTMDENVKFREHSPEDMLTKIMNVNYDPGAKCPKWLAFLDKIFEGREDLIEYIRTSLGYSLTGDIGEGCLYILYGPQGYNGKTTFINTIQEILGDYAISTPFDTFLTRRGEHIPNDVARMRGARFVTAIEAGEGRGFNEELLKRLTGRDAVTARFLRQEFFDFHPTCKLWLATNHKPTIKEFSGAFWGRIRLIPFNITISEEERILHYENILLEEREGIFNWILEGYKKWRKEGLKVPGEVKEATAQYKDQMDIMAEYIEDCCIENRLAQATTKKLYGAYKEWCEENKEKEINKRAFGRRLEERGYKSIRIGAKQNRGWGGIALKDLENSNSSTKEDIDNIPMTQESIELFGGKQEIKTIK